MEVYVVYYDADYGDDGRTTRLIGVYSTPELALAYVQQQNVEHDLSQWGLSDYNIYKVVLDETEGNGCSWSLEIGFNKDELYSNKKVVYK